MNPASNGTLPVAPLVPNIQPPGYNPVMQLPDGQIQNRPQGGIPSSPVSNSTQAPGPVVEGAAPSTPSTPAPIYPSNNATNITQTPIETVIPVEIVTPVEVVTTLNSTDSNRVPVESGQSVPASPSAPPTQSSGNQLVKGAGSAFAAVVAMIVMGLV